MIRDAKGIITDSGGVTEEATVLDVACITLRENTERPETIETGSNILIGNNMDLLRSNLNSIREGKWKESSIPPLWDGNASKRIIENLVNLF